MTDVTNWISLGLAGATMIGGCVAYVHLRMNAIEDKMEERIEEGLRTEKIERREEIREIKISLAKISDMASAVVSMSNDVAHLSERFSEHRAYMNNSIAEVKEAVRNIDTKVQALALLEARGSPFNKSGTPQS